MPTTPPLDITGKRITVMGLGRFGGGVGVSRWLAAPPNNCDVLVTDLDPAEKLADSLSRLQTDIDTGRIRTRLGEHNVSDFTDTDVVVANPAVPKPWDNRFLRAAHAAGVPVTTEIRLLVERLPSRERTIGITGTAGKSTTSAMIAHALKALGQTVHLGGNIGGSLLGDLQSIRRDDWVVLELSSAMLYWLDADAGYAGAPGWSPRVAVVTNIAANHIDWHGEVGHYARSKRVITRHQQPGDVLVTSAAVGGADSVDADTDPPSWRPRSGVTAARVNIEPERARQSVPTLKVPGLHNRINALVAAEAVAQALATSDQDRADLRQRAIKAIAEYPGLVHRLQMVGFCELAGGGAARAYNDSKCTTPEAAMLALAAMDDEPGLGVGRVHLIAGGYDKKVDLSPMAVAAARCAGVYTVGLTGPAIAKQVIAAGGTAYQCGTVEAAVSLARRQMKDGDALLLSPACASWGQYVNFEQRGDEFVRLVTQRASLPV